MKKYSGQDLVTLLADISIQSGDTILLHSSLIHLGRLATDEPSKTPDRIIEILLDTVGENGTLVAPAFNFDFCNGIPFDRWKTPSKKMGVLAESVRTWSGAQRSKHPMQSVAAIGKLANEICEPDTHSSFALGGPFDLLLANRTKLLLLGAPFQAASLIHYSEERMEVPYRYWKSYAGIYIDKEINEERQYDMYSRRLEIDPQLRLELLEQEMASRGLTRKLPLGMGQVTCCDSEDFIGVSMEMLAIDPYGLLRNPDVVAAFCEAGRDA